MRRGAGFAALKLLKPYGADEISGARLMRWWGGAGAAEIHELSETAVLMEWLDGPVLGDMARGGRDDEATGILAEVLSALHRPRRDPPELHLLQDWVRPLLEHRAGDWPESFRAAARLAGELLATAPGHIPLHGDFHHDNVMASPRGWLAIDPKGLLGDPAYDVANVFRNPFGAADLALDPARIAKVARAFADRLGLDRRRILGWAAAHCALSAIWCREAGTPDDFNPRLLPMLLAAQ